MKDIVIEGDQVLYLIGCQYHSILRVLDKLLELAIHKDIVNLKSRMSGQRKRSTRGRSDRVWFHWLGHGEVIDSHERIPPLSDNHKYNWDRDEDAEENGEALGNGVEGGIGD